MAWEPQYINRIENKKPNDIVKAITDWNALWNTAISQGNNSVIGVSELMGRMAAVETGLIEAVAGNLVPDAISDTAFFTDGVVTGAKIAEDTISSANLQAGIVSASTLDNTAVSLNLADLILQHTFSVYQDVPKLATITVSWVLPTPCRIVLLNLVRSINEEKHGALLLFAGQAQSFSLSQTYYNSINSQHFGTAHPDLNPFRYSGLRVQNVTFDGTTIQLTINNPSSSSTNKADATCYALGLKEAI